MSVYERKGDISIWWFPKEFSQSRYGEYYQSGRNSCTLISLILANEISKENEFCGNADELSPRTVEIFASAINDGNAVYHRLEGRIEMQMRDSRNLNIPDAIEALQQHHRKKGTFRLKELFFTHLQVDPSKRSYPYVVAERLTKIFHVGLQLYKEPLLESTVSNTGASTSRSRSAHRTVSKRSNVRHINSRNKSRFRGVQKSKSTSSSESAPLRPALTARYLFVIVIADSRTTTFVFEVPNNVVAFIDSHHHGRNTGAVIAQAATRNLDELAFWFVKMLDQVYTSKPELYEISFFSTQELERSTPINTTV